MVGCCPFHSERTPSFTVFNRADNEHFYCFGCGAGGDLITFVMKMENLTYIQAVEKLCGVAGLRMPLDMAGQAEKKIDRTRLTEMNTSAARFFRDALFAPGGAAALDYMTKRGFNRLTLRHFGIGFADNSWEMARFCSSWAFTAARARRPESISMRSGLRNLVTSW